jgi:transcriptional regulator with XRE-family HTH domain
MSPRTAKDPYAQDRRYLGAKVRALRLARRWTQAELANRLFISQNQLSQIERGASSFTAEQFLLAVKLFNADPAEFVRNRGRADQQLQNAIARLGGSHLFESNDVLPSVQLEAAHDAIREALVEGSPRLITAVAPVLVRNVERLHLVKLLDDLNRIGLSRRFAWVVDNTLHALQQLSTTGPGAAWAKELKRVYVPFTMLLGLAQNVVGDLGTRNVDVLDPAVRSQQTLEEIERAASTISQRWGIVTSLRPDDFADALVAARANV